MLTQLPTPLPLLTPKGKAWAVAIIDYGPHWDLLWVTFVHDSGECWTFNNREIRQEKNATFGLHDVSPIVPATGASHDTRISRPVKNTAMQAPMSPPMHNAPNGAHS